MQLPINIPQYFFDDSLIANQKRLVRRWIPAKVFPKPVLVSDKPWETRILTLHGTVLPAEDGYMMFYQNWDSSTNDRQIMLARSCDGFRWEKPDLGLVEWKGSKANNIVIDPKPEIASPSVIMDPDDSENPYKMICCAKHPNPESPDSPTCLVGLHSTDGLSWERIPGELLTAGDHTNMMATKVNGKFILYTRDLAYMFKHTGGRAVYRSESKDFYSWSKPELVLAPDLADEPDIEFYGMSVFEWNDWFFGLLEYWDSNMDILDTRLAISRDGISWVRPNRDIFIAPSFDWNRAWSSCASNGPIIIGNQMVFYFGGRWVSHSYDSAQQDGVVGFASLSIDRFCAIEAAGGGSFDTVPLLWPGGDLELNADARESYESHPLHCGGEIGIEVLDAEGQILKEWGGDNKALFHFNTHSRTSISGGKIIWPGERSLDALKGKNIRLRFNMKHARLFTIEASGRS